MFGAARIAPGPDVVWRSDAARLDGVTRTAAERSTTGAVLVLVHFPDSLDLLGRSEVASRWGRLERETDVLGFLGGRPLGAIGISLAAMLQPREAGTLEIPGTLHVIVAERHPLRARDEAVVAAASTLSAGVGLEFHLSLDDRIFGGVKARVGPLLARLGAAPDQPIRHAMVATAVARAQAQLARGATGDLPAASAEEWLRINLPAS